MSWLSIEIILFFVALFAAGFFAFLETAFTAIRLFKIRELKAGTTRYQRLFSAWESCPQRILITILIANNFAHVLSSVLIAEIMERFFGGLGLILGVGIATVTILIFGEIIPKTFAKTHHMRIFRLSLWFINILFHFAYPVVTILLSLTNFVFRKLGRESVLSKGQEAISEKEIEFLIDYSDQMGFMEAEKSEMLQNVFGLDQTLAKEIMVPKTDMISLSEDTTLQEVMNIFSEYKVSRLPVYEGKEDNIIGIVHQKDILEVVARGETKILRQLLRKVLFVPETKKVNQLLTEFLKSRIQMAMLIDEYGGVIGLVTLEDALEEIVGEIRDEYEDIRSEIIPLDRGGWLIEAGIDLQSVEDLLGVKFYVKDSVTLAGFLSEKLQHLPKKGERLFWSGYCFQVQQASTKRVFQVLIFEDKRQDGLKIPKIAQEKDVEL